MTKKSETGHAVNAKSFSMITSYCKDMTTNYTPPDATISLVNLQSKETNIYGVLEKLNEKGAPFMFAVNDREATIAPLNKLLTKVKNMVYACNVLQQFKDDVRSIVNEIQGVRATPIIETEPGDPNQPTNETIVHISAAQTGYDNRIFNFDKLIELLKVEPNYTPTEADVQIVALDAYLTKLKDKNAAVIDVTPGIDNARISRNNEMYTGADNAYEMVKKVKAYIKGKFGGNSKEFHNMAKWEFKKFVKE